MQIIGKTEDIVKSGISVKDIQTFFERYRLQLRVFDEFMGPILEYDPESRNHHHSSLYCMVKGDHVYTLNHDINTLAQQQKVDTTLSKHQPIIELKKGRMLNII